MAVDLPLLAVLGFDLGSFSRNLTVVLGELYPDVYNLNMSN